jgi:ABC-type sugar transport system ATPase subunit
MTRASSPFIDIRRLTKAYGDTPVLQEIDLSIERGEFVVLVGPSGCGKSTLLRCIAGLEPITGGELRIDGRRCNDTPPKDRDLAMVFQSYALYPHLTVADNLGFSLAVRKLPKAEIAGRVDEVAARLGLSGLLHRYPKELSGGQRQRVAVGRAIVRHPKAFLFDEPLSNLDAELRAQMRLELKRLHAEMNTTMIYVTHDQVEAMTLADRIVVLNGGVLQQVGSPDELYRRPANRFVARFIGSPAMNFLPGRFRAAEPAVEGAGFSLRLAEELRGKVNIPEEVVAGVRPLSLSLAADGRGTCEGVVDVVEPVGWDTYLHVKVGTENVVAQLPATQARDLSPGSRVTFRVAAEEVHVFDAQTGLVIR